MKKLSDNYYEDDKELAKEIDPFYWVDFDDVEATVCLSLTSRCIGNGYDWDKKAYAFLLEQMPELTSKIYFDSEAGMFVAGSRDKEALKMFVIALKNLLFYEIV